MESEGPNWTTLSGQSLEEGFRQHIGVIRWEARKPKGEEGQDALLLTSYSLGNELACPEEQSNVFKDDTPINNLIKSY